MLHKLNPVRSTLLTIGTAAAILGLGFPSGAAGQTTGGVIVGVVSDSQGGVLPGVTLTARNAESGTTRTTVTESDGTYRIRRPATRPV